MTHKEKINAYAITSFVILFVTGLAMSLVSIGGYLVLLIIGLTFLSISILILVLLIRYNKKSKTPSYKPTYYKRTHHSSFGKDPGLEAICDFLAKHVDCREFKPFTIPSDVILRLNNQLKYKHPNVETINLIVSIIASQVHTPKPLVVIDPRDSKRAGLYEFRGTFQKIHLVYDPIMTANDIIRVLLHEMAHAYLFSRGIVIEDTLQNEYMTDICSILFNCKNVNVRDFAVRIIHGHGMYGSYKLGYLNNHELQYALRYLGHIFNDHTIITR